MCINSLSIKYPNQFEHHNRTSPTNFKLFLERQFLPWIVNIGTPELRKRAIDLFPNPLVQTMRMITDVMEETSREIFLEKKSGLERGDDSVVNQVGRGKDIMSILCKSSFLIFATNQC